MQDDSTNSTDGTTPDATAPTAGDQPGTGGGAERTSAGDQPGTGGGVAAARTVETTKAGDQPGTGGGITDPINPIDPGETQA